MQKPDVQTLLSSHCESEVHDDWGMQFALEPQVPPGQGVPTELSMCPQTPVLQMSVVHELPSLQSDDDEQRSLQSAGTLGMKRSFGMNHSLNELTVSKIN